MFTNKKSLLALSVASALTLTGCFSDDDGNKITPPPPPPPVVVVPPETPVALDFVISGSVVENEEFNVLSNATVKFMENGVPSTNILNVDDTSAQTLTNAGSFVVKLKDGADIDSVTAIVSATDGDNKYITKTFNVDLTNEGDFDVLTAQFVLFTGDSDEVKEDVINKTLTGATTSEEIKADAIIGTTSLASATLPIGTTLEGADGQAVEAGELTLSVLGLDPTSDSKGSIIPEGLNANNASGNVVVPVSVANVNMTVGNTKVKSFDGDTLNITLAAPANLDAGELLTVKSLDEDTGVWLDESFAVTKGTGTVSFETDHLTWFSVNKSAAACSTGLTTTVSGDAVPAGGLLFVAASSDGLGFSLLPAGATSSDVFTASTLTRYGFSANAMAEVYVFDREGGVWFESEGEVAVCGTVPVELAQPYTVVEKTLTLSGVCAQDDTKVVNLSNSVVTYNRENKIGKSVLKNAEGNFDLSGLRDGETYNVSVNFRGMPVVGDNTFTFTADAEALTQEFEVTCPTTTGSTGGTGGN